MLANTEVILVGYGLAGSVFHAPLLQAAGFDVAAVVVRDPARRAQAAVKHPAARLFDGLTQALAACAAPLVVLATPTDTHAPLAIQALHAGRHVVIDKPFALNVLVADAVINAAAQAQRLAIPFQNRRWDADFLTLKQLLASDALGEVVRYEARFDRYNPQVKDRWREHDLPGSGLLYDLGSHLIDQALQLFGAPEWVFCTQLRQRSGALIDDAFELIMGSNAADYPYVSLGAGMFSAAADTPHGAAKYKINGRRATWLKHGFDPQEARLKTGEIPTQTAWSAEADAARGVLIDGASGESSRTPAGTGQWPFFYAQLKAAIEHGAPPPTLGIEARLTCAVIDAAMVSARTGQRVAVQCSTP